MAPGTEATRTYVLKVLKADAGISETRVHKISELVHKYSMDSSPGGFDRLKTATDKNFQQLNPKIKRARKFVELAEKKLSAKTLNDESFLAEVAQVNTAVSLYDSLRQMFDAAVKAADQYSMMFLNIATGVLSGRLDDAVLREGKYPKNQNDLIRAILQQRISAALSLYNDITKELSDVPEKLGIKLPRAPEQKTD